MAGFRFKNPREHIKFAKALRKQAPTSERLLWNVLCQLSKETNLKFRRQHPLKPYVADFACVKARLIIELDGFSHDVRQHYDEERSVNLKKRGWVAIRFSNQDIQENVEGVALTIVQKVKELLAQK